ncbi:Hypothetical Protein SLY_0443 [Strawberry lethal yellows phytoplasma (CPA) str. NZSb11]|uniref:Uncharacterized protein n=1 Tax=Strawberry lethal yellows phytoplasma (CPA) str. NZSb11 TaxID=980422 RepID=R4S0S2_PHYAS|nr:Hypothetical Protein SLY_0443 [Strawberry lethal yellows phytoplasma (CPA) str. NZSb11]
MQIANLDLWFWSKDLTCILRSCLNSFFYAAKKLNN